LPVLHIIPAVACALLLVCPALGGAPRAVEEPVEQADTNTLVSRLVAGIDRKRLLNTHIALARQPHVAGTPGDWKVIGDIEAAFREAGLDTTVHEFWPLLAEPVDAALEIVSPERRALTLTERPVAGDPDSEKATFAWNAYSGSGDVTAEVVYANYGTREDFARLKELGVDCTGKIVIARYGRNYRGFKAKFAQEAGAVGLVMFTDPADSGYMRGLTYPEGGYSNDCCTQRGSIVTLGYQGDPLTPGIEATKDAPRLNEDDIPLPKIPVQPIGYGAAGEILSLMRGEGVPDGWQGGLPHAYRLTGGPDLRVRLMVKQRRAIQHTANVIGVLPGERYPDEMVIVGCHHDAWGFGASDPTSGAIAMLEVARIVGDMARQGQRPARTLVFAAWGAEEFGIIGSTEWVEGNLERLVAGGVAYINLDMAAMGPQFGASVSPSLRDALAHATRAVPQARDHSRTVYDDWFARSPDPLAPGRPSMGDIGGGSDHVGFLCHAGIASAGLGSGGSRGNSYHSAYDTLPWYWKTVGDDYEPAAMIAGVAGALALHLAHEGVIALNPPEYGRDAGRVLGAMADSAAKAAGTAHESAVRVAIDRALDSARRCHDAGGRALARARDKAELGGPFAAEFNSAVLRCERVWLSEEGLPARPWFRNMYAATDEHSGYGAWTLPEIRKAMDDADGPGVVRAIERLAARLDRITAMCIELEETSTRAK
jgi:N-acetylated-alpha-linked acidic dipeptidase